MTKLVVPFYCAGYFLLSLVILLIACAITSASVPVNRHPLQDANGDFPPRVAVRDIAPAANYCRPTPAVKPAVQPAVDLGVEPTGYWTVQNGRFVWCPRGGCRPQIQQNIYSQPQPVVPQFDFNEPIKEEPTVTVTEPPAEGPSTAFIVTSVVTGVVLSAVGAAVGAYREWRG